MYIWCMTLLCTGGVSRWKSGMLEHQELGPLCIKPLLPLKACFLWLDVPIQMKGISEPKHYIKSLAWRLVEASSTQEQRQEDRLPLRCRHLHAEPQVAPRLSVCRCRGDWHPEVDSPQPKQQAEKENTSNNPDCNPEDRRVSPFFLCVLENKPWTYMHTCPFHSFEVSSPRHVCALF